MNLLATLGVDGILKILKGLGILKDPEQEERARQALREAASQFLVTTGGPLYAVPRVTIIYASLWDIFFNQSRAWAAAATNLAGLGPLGWLELMPLVWLFLGPEVIAPTVAAIGRMFTSLGNGKTAALGRASPHTERFPISDRPELR